MIVVYGSGLVGNGIKNLLDYENIENILVDDKMSFDENILQKAEKIIVSPGIASHHKIYKTYASKIQGEYDFCYDIIQKKGLENFELIGVTGTDGKSTTCYLIFQSLEKIKKDLELDFDVYLGGNYEPAFSTLLLKILKEGKFNKKNILILETSSFAGYNIKTTKFENSIFTNFATDHLNWHNDMDEYFEAKKNIFINTKNACIISQGVFEKDKNFFSSKNYFLIDGKQKFGNKNLPGEHNQKNLQSVYLLLKAMGFGPEEYLMKILNNLNGLEHRIQHIETLEGIEIYDDGKSTSSQSLAAALSSFEGDICLIAGGSDKGDSFEYLASEFEKKVKVGVFLGQTANQFEKIFDAKNIKNLVAKDMQQAIKLAFEQAKEMGCKYILFSPGCASLDMYKNRLDRVNHFKSGIENIKKSLKK